MIIFVSLVKFCQSKTNLDIDFRQILLCLTISLTFFIILNKGNASFVKIGLVTYFFLIYPNKLARVFLLLLKTIKNYDRNHSYSRVFIYLNYLLIFQFIFQGIKPFKKNEMHTRERNPFRPTWDL